MTDPSALLIHNRDEFGWSEIRAALGRLHVMIAGEAETAEMARLQAAKYRFDLVLASSELEGRSSLSILAEIRHIHLPDSHIIVFTHEIDQAELVGFAQLNLSGFLNWSETRSVDTIACTVRLALIGETVVGSWSIARAYFGTRWETSNSDLLNLELTDFERRMLMHRAQGRTYAEIAWLEKVSPRRVERAFGELRDKLDAPDPFTLGMKAAMLGLVP